MYERCVTVGFRSKNLTCAKTASRAMPLLIKLTAASAIAQKQKVRIDSRHDAKELITKHAALISVAVANVCIDQIKASQKALN